MDLESQKRWVEYSHAKDEMMAHTDTPFSPWYVVESDVKKHARLNMMAHLLSTINYHAVEHPAGGTARQARAERQLPTPLA